MFKTKLLILLLINFLFISCIKKDATQESLKFRVGYIGGEYNGLLLKNTLSSYLNAQGIYSETSQYVIKANISHNSNLYITNIDNTSDREKITTTLKLTIYDNKTDCLIDNYEESVDQFYIYAPAAKILSNKNAKIKIERNNTEILAKRFINILLKLTPECK